MAGTHFIKYLVLLLCFVTASCTPIGQAYRGTLNRWSRHAEFFDLNSLRAELMWDVVLVTPDMRDARLQREAELRHISLTEAKHVIPPDWFASGTLFYINFFAPRDARDLLASDTYWRLELRDASGQNFTPQRISQVPITLVDRKLFPFLNRWSKTYLVQFPQTDGPVTLILYGLNVVSKLRWEMDGKQRMLPRRMWE